MVTVIGAEDTREHGAALALRELLLRSWPQLSESRADEVYLVAGAKCHGQRIRDIDVLILGRLQSAPKFNPYLPMRLFDDRWLVVPTIEVHNLCIAVEVKDHGPEDVRFVGNAAYVRYGGKWKNATEQNEGQVYSIKGYLASQSVPAPLITNLLWLRNVPNEQLPPRPHPTIGSAITWEMILNVAGQLHAPRQVENVWVLSAGEQNERAFRRSIEVFTKELTPTKLDRQRMERIAHRSVSLDQLKTVTGNKLLIIRGRGGTGKTVRLLQLAARLSDDEDARVLILTYNRALVADLRRLLAIMGVSDDIAGRTIQIQTVHAFLYGAFRTLGIFDPREIDFLECYEILKDEAVQYLREGALSRTDLERFITESSDAFGWDFVFVDEGQDWPDNERELLTQMYGPSRMVVADGVDQFVRSSKAAQWRSGLSRTAVELVPLTTCLRMKAGLARFVSSVAHQLGLLLTEWEPNAEIPGGRVVVVDGSFLTSRALMDRLIRENATDGNEPVDMLVCLPPNFVARPAGETRRSAAAVALDGWGLSSWDGAAADVRDSYPTDNRQVRVIQYESCRGLEGWIVINLALDEFYLQKQAAFEPGNPDDALLDHEQAAKLFAARWSMIPLTRAMDTLVVQISPGYSPIRSALEAAATEFPDYVEWVTSG